MVLLKQKKKQRSCQIVFQKKTERNLKMKILLLILLLLSGCSSNGEKPVEADTTGNQESGVLKDAQGAAPYVADMMIPAQFGVAEYSAEEIRTFKDYSIEQLKESIHSISDLVQYILECDFANPPGTTEDFKFRFEDLEVSVNRTPECTLATQCSSCGAISNLARYILSDNYDEVGFVLQGEATFDVAKGGHVYNYFRNGNEILTFDFTGVFKYRDAGIILSEMKLVDDFSKIPHGKRREIDYLYTVVATSNWDNDHPPVFMVDNGDKAGICYFFDSQYKDNLIVVFNDDEYRKKMSETTDFVYHELFEDTGFDPDTIPYDEMYKTDD